MCGLVYGLSFTDTSVNKLVLKAFEKQKSRGLQGFGVFDGEYQNLIRHTQEHGIVRWLKKYPSKEILFHHRTPTSTENVRNACHPFSTGKFFDKCYVLIHNGWISNAHELREEHEKLGIEYYSVQPNGYEFNDSEALLWDMALYLEGEQDVMKARGMIAFIVMEIGKENKLHFGRNSNPLNMSFDKEVGMLLASEGDGEPINPQRLYTYNYKTRDITDIAFAIPNTYWGTNNTGNWASTSNWKPYTDGHGTVFPTDPWDDQLAMAELDELNAESLDRTSIEKLYGVESQLTGYNADVILTAKQGEPDFLADVKRRYTYFLNHSQGNYESAFALLEMDEDVVDKCLDECEIEHGYTTPNLEYTLLVLAAVDKMFMQDPNWVSIYSRHPDYSLNQGYKIPTKITIPLHLRKYENSTIESTDSTKKLVAAYRKGMDKNATPSAV